MKKQNRKQGFTLVELLVVIAILAILATVSIVGYTAFIDRANKSNALAEANQINEAIRSELISGNEIVIGTTKTDAVDAAEGVEAQPATSTTYTLKRGTDTMVITVETVNVAADKTTTPVKKSTHTIALNGTSYTVTNATWNWETDKYVVGTAEALSISTPLTASKEVKTLVELDGALVFEFDSSKNILSMVYTYDVDGEKDIQVRIDLNDLETVEIIDKK